MDEDKIKQLRKNSLKNYYKIGLDAYFGKKGEMLINNVTNFLDHPWILYLSQDKWIYLVKRDYVDLFRRVKDVPGFESVMSEVRDNLSDNSKMNDRIAQIRVCDNILKDGLYSMDQTKVDTISFPKKNQPIYDLVFVINGKKHYGSVKHPNECKNIFKDISIRLDYESIINKKFQKSFTLELNLPNFSDEKSEKLYYKNFTNKLFLEINSLLNSYEIIHKKFIAIPYKYQLKNQKNNLQYGARISYHPGEEVSLVNNTNILEPWNSKKIYKIYGYIFPKILSNIYGSFLEFYKFEEDNFNNKGTPTPIELENCHLFYLHDIPDINIQFGRDYLMKSVNGICKALEIDEFFKTDILLFGYKDNVLY